MEMQIYFTGMILLFCVTGLAVEAGEHLQALFSRKRRDDRLAQANQMRDDWYVFFHCKALFGNQQTQPAASAGKNMRPASTVTPKARPSARARV